MHANTDATIPNDKILMPASGEGMYRNNAMGRLETILKLKL